MLPYKTIIKLDRKAKSPLYLQICKRFIDLIMEGTLKAGKKLPGARVLSQLLNVNRQTVNNAFEELEAQGWLEIVPNKGSFINEKLPVIDTNKIAKSEFAPCTKSPLDLPNKFPFLEDPTQNSKSNYKNIIDAGYPDLRLSPIKELTQTTNALLKSKRHLSLLKYSNNFSGDPKLKEVLVKELKDSRGINCKMENIFISRGSLMAFYLIFKLLLTKGDAVVVGNISFNVGNNIIKLNDGKLIPVKMDEHGMDVDAIAEICKKQKIKAVFIMPHHHNPTTTTLCAERRMSLLHYARKYNFAIIEDDYDYDFHYDSSPVLPMAACNQSGHVIYVGSLSKIFAPGIRLGYVVASKDVIDKISNLSRFMSCHGNHNLERAMAILYEDGHMNRYLKKTVKEYKLRRDFFSKTLRTSLAKAAEFETPKGGFAAWVKFKKKYDLVKIREQCMQEGLMIPKPAFYNKEGKLINAIRMGFASTNNKEITKNIKILKSVMNI